MTDALHPLRHAYGVAAPDAPAPSPGTPGHAEAVLLGQTREAVDHLRPAAPDAAAVEAVLAYAAAGPAVAADLDRALAALPAPPPSRPDASVLARIEAFAADATLAPLRAVYGEPDLEAAGSSEAAWLDGARQALERAPRLRPSDTVLAAVAVHAAESSAAAPGTADAAPTDPALLPLAAAYGLIDPPAAASAETALLSGMIDVLAGAPRVRPTDAVRDAVRAHASAATSASAAVDAPVTDPALLPVAAAYGLSASGTSTGAEAALLRSTREVLDRAPRLRPSDAVLAAVAARAAEASGVSPAPVRTVVPPPAATDRAPVALVAAAARPARRTGWWAGSAGILGALVLALVLLPRPGADGSEATESVSASVASTADAAPAESPQPASEAAPLVAPLVASGETAPVAPSVAGREPVASGPSASEPPARAAVVRQAEAPVRPQTAPARVAAPPVRETAPVAPVARARTPAPSSEDALASGLTLAATSRTAPAPATTSWDASDSDVRVLSLRLRELRRGNQGTDWDAPAQALGAAQDPVRMSATPGLQSVRAGDAPGRARLRTDTFPTGD